jgi:hypothetical protein
LLHQQVDHVWVWGLLDRAAGVHSATAGSSANGNGSANDSANGSSTGAGGRGASSSEASLSIGAATLLPRGLDASAWSSGFALSDHRPLQVRIDWPGGSGGGAANGAVAGGGSGAERD